VRFWDVASGGEVRQVAPSEFAFASGAMGEHKTSHHLLKARYETLDITLLPRGAAPGAAPEDQEGSAGGGGDSASRVACFKAPQTINAVRSHGSTLNPQPYTLNPKP